MDNIKEMEVPIPEPNEEISHEVVLQRLQEKEADFKVKKLEKECNFLDYQTSKRYKTLEYYKAIVGFGSIFTALFTIATIVFSIVKWSDDNRQNREAKQDQEFNKYVSLLQNSSPSMRSYGALMLPSFLDKNNKSRNAQIILSLTTALGYEEDVAVRNSLIDVFNFINFDELDSSAAYGGLASLIRIDRAITKTHSLINLQEFGTRKEPMNDSLYRKLEGISSAIKVFSDKKILTRDMNGILITNTTFSNINFIDKTSFNQSIFLNVNMDSCICRNCSFTNCNLTGFTANVSDFNESTFGYDELDTAFHRVIDSKLFSKTNWGATISSSKMKGVKFKSFPIIALFGDERHQLESFYYEFYCSFHDCDFKDADFSTALAFEIPGGTDVFEYKYFRGSWIDFQHFDDIKNLEETDVYSDVKRMLRYNSCQKAILPKSLKEAIK